MLGAGELIFQGKSSTIGYLIPKCYPENITTSNTEGTKLAIFRNIYVCVHTYMHETTICEKSIHDFERE